MPRTPQHTQTNVSQETESVTEALKWERPKLPEGWEFDPVNSFQLVCPRMGFNFTTQGDRWTTYLGFNDVREALAIIQYLHNSGKAKFAIMRGHREVKHLACKWEVKIWGLDDDEFERFCNAFVATNPG